MMGQGQGLKVKGRGLKVKGQGYCDNSKVAGQKLGC